MKLSEFGVGENKSEDARERHKSDMRVREGKRDWRGKEPGKKKLKKEEMHKENMNRFLDKFSHLYKRVCPSVRRYVLRSVGP